MSLTSINRRVLHSVGAVTLALVVGGLVAGCGSLSNIGSTVNSKQLKRLDQVAVASISGPNRLKAPLGQDQSASGGRVIGSASEAAEGVKRNRKRAKPDFDPLMSRSHEYVFGDLQSVLPFGFIDEQKVLGSSAYQNFNAHQMKGPVAAMVDDPEDVYVSPKSYRPAPPSLLQKKTGKRRELFDLLPSGTDAVLVVDVSYEVGKAVAKEANQVGEGQRRSRLQLKEGDRVDAQVQAKVQTQVMKPNGTVIMDVTQKEWSGDRFTFTYGEGWEASQINDLAMKATEKALASTSSYLKKQLSPSK